MSEISHELLMAYADGELSGADKERVEAHLAQNPQAASVVQAFKQTGRNLGMLYDQPMQELVPAKLVQRILDAPGRSGLDTVRSKPSSRNVNGSFLGAMIAMLSPWQAATALSAALILAGSIGWGLRGDRLPGGDDAILAALSDNGILAGRQLASVLTSVPTGQDTSIGKAGAPITVKPVLTFQSVGGSYCRQYDMAEVVRPGSPDRHFTGVGCRLNNGAWQIVVHSPTTGAPIAASGGGRIAPAGKRVSPTVEGAVDRIMQGDVLGADAEKALIANQWRSLP